MKKYLLSLSIVLLVIFAMTTGCKNSGNIRESGFFMRNLFEINLDVPRKERATAQKNLRQALQKLQALDISLNKLSPISELTAVNKNASVKFISISNDFFNLLRKSLLANNLTTGYFDITWAPLFDLFSDNPNPRFDKITRTQSILGSSNVALDTHFSKVRFGNANTKIDLAQVQIGFAIDLIKESLDSSKISSLRIVSGQTGYYGGRRNHYLKVALSPNKNILFKLHERGICTVNKSDSYFKNYALWSKYLEKEVTSENITSVTVIAPNTFTAQVLAYAFVPMGTQKSFELIKQLNEKAKQSNQKAYIAVFLLDNNGHEEVLDSRQFK